MEKGNYNFLCTTERKIRLLIQTRLFVNIYLRLTVNLLQKNIWSFISHNIQTRLTKGLDNLVTSSLKQSNKKKSHRVYNQRAHHTIRRTSPYN